MTLPDPSSDTTGKTLGERLEARNAWGQRLLAELVKANEEANREHLFTYAESIHMAVIKTAIVNLLACSKLPEDLGLCADIVQQALTGAISNMELTDQIH